MTISITHNHVSEIADDPTKDVSSGEWNAAHTVSGVALLENGVQYGTDWPTSPAPQEGMFCYRTDRDVLYLYNGTDWVPIESFAAMTIYVDPTGTDDADHGFAFATDAFATINYALSQIPPLYGGDVVVNIAAGTYTENVAIRGKAPTGPYTIWIEGTLSTAVDTTLTGGGAGVASGSTQATVVKTSAGWTVDAYKRKLCYFTSGSNDGLYRVIESNTSNTLTLVGSCLAATPSSGDAFQILSHGTVISGTFQVYCGGLVRNLSVTGTTYAYSGLCHWLRCALAVFASGPAATFVSYALLTCSCTSTGTNTITPGSVYTPFKDVYATTGSNGTVILQQPGTAVLSYSCVYAGDGGASPGLVYCRGHHEVLYGGTEMKTILKSTTGAGIVAVWGGKFFSRSGCARVSVTTEYTVESASYSYVAA